MVTSESGKKGVTYEEVSIGSDGEVAKKASKLTSLELIGLESSYAADLNDDGEIGLLPSGGRVDYGTGSTEVYEISGVGYGIVKEAQSYSFSFKDDPDRTENVGFIAHELQQAAGKVRGSQHLEAVSGEKDEIDGTQGKPIYQTVNYGKMTAVLWSALRETIEKVEKLEKRINKLENGTN